MSLHCILRKGCGKRIYFGMRQRKTYRAVHHQPVRRNERDVLNPNKTENMFEVGRRKVDLAAHGSRSEEHTSELQSLMRISYAVFCLKKKKHTPKSLTKYQTTT